MITIAKKIRFKKAWIKWILVIAILVIVGMLYIQTVEKKNAAESKTVPVSVPQAKKELIGAQFGDIMKINYVLSLENGTVVDTNNETLAKKYGIKTYVNGPYQFILGQSGKLLGQATKVKAFDEALKGLNAGDKKTISIEPSEKILAFTMNITAKELRRTNIPTVHRFSIKKFKEIFAKPGIPGDVVANYKEYPWPYQVLNVTEKSVYAKVLVKAGEELVVPGTEWKSSIIDVGERVIILSQNPDVGQVIKTPYGTAEVTNVSRGYIYLKHNPELGKTAKQTIAAQEEIGPVFDFTVWDIQDDKFTIRRTNYLPQEKLVLYVEVLDVIKDIKEVK